MWTKWAANAALLIAGVIAFNGAERYRDPIGEKYVLMMPPGGADFFFPFAGARALLTEQNPYQNDDPALADPWRRGYGVVEGRQYRGLYPPTHILVYVPLAWLFPDFREASRALFHVNVALLFLLAVLTWRLLFRVLGGETDNRPASFLWLAFLVFALTGNVSSSFALERGDGGDILTAALSWGAVLLFLKERILLCFFLLVPAVALKGYAVLLAAGLGLLSLKRTSWKPALLGTLLSTLLFVVPVARYLPDAVTIIAHQHQEDVARIIWFNHSFRSLLFHLSSALAGPGQWVLVGLSLLVSLYCWVQSRAALGRQDSSRAALWLTLFATSSLSVVLAAGETSYVYNLVIMLPGALIFVLAREPLAKTWGLSPSGTVVLGTLQAATIFCLLKCRLWSPTLSLAGIGIALFFITLGAGLVWGRRGRSFPAPRP